MQIQPITLTGRSITLEPMSMDHHSALCEAGLVPELWRWATAPMRTPEDMRAYIQTAVQWQAEGTALPFITRESATGKIVGSTRFANIDRPNRHLEIGWTWISPPWQRTPVNTEAKYLMLRHAFETLSCMRIELKADSLNTQSRTAIERLGAKHEGIFRNHMLCYDGRIRHSAWYSIIDTEWPDVKSRLEQKLGANSPNHGS